MFVDIDVVKDTESLRQGEKKGFMGLVET